MKKFFFIAAAALAFGMTSCTDDFDYTEIIDNGEGIETSSIVKSTADLVGTQWNYTMEDITFVDENGDTVALIPMSDMTFGLNFDATVAHLTFPENVAMLTFTENNGEYTMEEVAGMDFAYNYEMATTSGTLTATGTDITGEALDFEIPFTYDETNDAITVVMPVAYDGDEENPTNLEIVFTR